MNLSNMVIMVYVLIIQMNYLNNLLYVKKYVIYINIDIDIYIKYIYIYTYIKLFYLIILIFFNVCYLNILYY